MSSSTASVSNPFSNCNNIQIRLVREGPSDASTDDRIALAYKGEDTYHLYFQDGLTKAAKQRVVLYGDEVDTYFESLFTLLVNDRDRFAAVQFNLPCMPCVYLNVDDVSDEEIQDTLFKAMPLLRSSERVAFKDSSRSDTSLRSSATNGPSYAWY